MALPSSQRARGLILSALRNESDRAQRPAFADSSAQFFGATAKRGSLRHSSLLNRSKVFDTR